MQISEIYASRQGEGRLTGQQSVFVRTTGCNLRCVFCDTPYTSWNPSGSAMTVEGIVESVSSYDEKHVVITGGEPLLQKSIVDLTQYLRSLEKHITVETAGTVFRDIECDLISISPKMSNSTPTVDRAGEWARKHENTRVNSAIVQKYIDQFDYQLKFVVIKPEDVIEIKSFCKSLDNLAKSKILLMPEGVQQDVLERRSDWLVDICTENGYTFCPRMHIQWYGNQRGT